MKIILWFFRLFIVFIFSVILAYGIWSVWKWQQRGGFRYNPTQDVITDLKELQRLETASFTVETVIDGGSKGNAFQQFLFGDRILLIARGKVIAGIDFATLTADDIQIDGKKIIVTIPKPMILVTSLDEEGTRVYDRQRGLLAQQNNDLESDARQVAQDKIRQAACEGNILSEAGLNAQKQLESLLRALQFEEVKVIVPASSC